MFGVLIRGSSLCGNVYVSDLQTWIIMLHNALNPSCGRINLAYWQTASIMAIQSGHKGVGYNY